MASRRMVSNKIIDSARFIKMPISSQCLYFHLIAKGDDDGVVEAFNVMRMIGASEDDLKVLVSKGFVAVLNDDLVSYITDWKEHNLVRADRKVDSIYKDLLIHIIPETDLLEAKPTYYSRKKDLSDKLQTNGSIGKDRLGKVSLVEDSINSPAEAELIPTSKIDYKKIIDRLNELANTKYRATTKSTKDLIKARINDGFTEEELIIVVEKMCYLWNREPKKGEKDMRPYLRPATLFQASKFEGYLNRPVENIKKTTRDVAQVIDLSDF